MDYRRFEDYKAAVILAYQNKKNEGDLPSKLLHHTAANLKKECIDEFTTRYLPRDNETFKDLFGRTGSQEELFKKVSASDPDLFRPLNIFLRKNTEGGTHNRNIELLAWLIDFEPRPFAPGDPYKLTESVNDPSTSVLGLLSVPDSVPGKIEEGDYKSNEIPAGVVNTGDTLEISNVSRLRNKFLRFCKPIKDRPRSFLAGFIIMTSVLLLYFLAKPQKMYWNRHEYKTISFYQPVDGAFTVPLDTFQLAHQKKIVDLSLITRNSIGIVHYSKINGKVEFYTSGGTNPEDTTRRLLPLTEYMYDKYIASKEKKN